MDGTNGMSASDVALLSHSNSGWDGNNILWFVILVAIIGMVMGGVRQPQPAPAQPMPGNYVTQEQLTAGLNNNSVQEQLRQISLSSADNNYQTGQLINGQTTNLLQQRYTDQINMVQGFNQVVNNMQAQTAALSQKVDSLSHHMDECCCSIKTEMLQNEKDRLERELTEAKNKLSNQQQTQQLLAQMGRFVMWSGNGSVGSSAAAA